LMNLSKIMYMWNFYKYVHYYDLFMKNQ
jgi:hypothetical protein